MMLARLVFICALLISFAGGQEQGKDLILTRSAEPQGQSLYTNSHALIIGINTYPNLPKNLQLRFAASDAQSVRDMLVNDYGFPATEVTLLTNEKATLANIRKELSLLASSKRVKPDDRIVVYFSGHGQTVKLPTGGDMGFLVPSDAKIDMSDPTDAGPYLETCLPMKQLWDYLGSSPAKHACVIADACFSGILANSRGIAMSSATVSAMLARPARQVLTAGAAGQETFERQDLGHGVFTSKLLEELKARAVDKKVFSLMDLYMSLQNSVSNLTGGKQIPQFGNVETEGQVLFCSGTALSNSTGTTTQPTTTNPTTTRAKLTITSNPSGATLFVDGDKRGTTPYTLQLELKDSPEKAVQIRLESKGFIPTETSTTLKPGDDVTLPIDLKPIPAEPEKPTTGTISIDSNPQGATVFVDGKNVGQTPYTLTLDLKKKEKQSVKIRLELDGYLPAQTNATVARNGTITVPFELKPVPKKPVQPGPKRNVKTLSLAEVSTVAGKTPVKSVMFSPDGKRIAVSGLDFSLTLYDANGGNPHKVEAPKNTIVRITPDWKKLLLVKLLSDGQRSWVSVQRKDVKTEQDLGAPMRIDLRPHTLLQEIYAGNSNLLLCGSIGEGTSLTGFCTVADLDKGQAKTISGGYRIGQATSSEDGSLYAAYIEPYDLRAQGTVVLIPADLAQPQANIDTDGCNSSPGLVVSMDGKLVAVTCQKVTADGAEILGTRIYDTASHALTQTLPKIRVAALIGKGSRLIGWRPQIGGPIVELLDAKTGDGLGETPGGQVWLSRDEKLAAQATPDGVITIFRLNQP